MDDQPVDLFDDTDIDYGVEAQMPETRPEQLERASWHMKMAARLVAERDEMMAVYKAEIARLQARWIERSDVYDSRIAWHQAPVEALHLALLADDPKRKTIVLPYGTSKVRVPKTPRIIIDDQSALLVWAEANHPDILGRTINVTGVKTIASVTKAGVVDPNGELIPGVRAVLDDPSWTASYSEDDRS